MATNFIFAPVVNIDGTSLS